MPRFVLFSLLIVFQPSFANHAFNEPGSGRGEISTLEEEARRDIDEMRARVLGQHEAGKKEVTGEMDDWIRTAVKTLSLSLDFGDREKALYTVLSENERFTNEEEDAYFPNEILKRLAESEPEAATRVAQAYTNTRRELREKFLKKLVATLQKNPNPVLAKMATAVEKTIEASMNSYTQALALIGGIKGDDDHKPLTRPLCFTCGDQLSLDPDYNFFDAMQKAAADALTEIGLQDKGTPTYDRVNRIVRTADGRIMAVTVDAEGKGIVQMKEGNWKYVADPAVMEVVDKQVRADVKAAKGSWPAYYGDKERKSYDGMIRAYAALQKNPTALAAASAAAKPTRKVDVSMYSTEEAKEFVRSQAGHPPDGSVYPTPAELARDIGLSGPDPKGSGNKISYLGYIGAGQHVEPNYNVKVEWEALLAATDDEKTRVIAVLEDIRTAKDLTPYKVVRGNRDGHCVWCYLNNSPEYQAKLAQLRASIGKSKK